MDLVTVRPRIQQLLAAVVVLGFIFQLGACPCGCLEHNYWMQMAGLSPHEPHDACDHDSQPTAHQNHEHDCTGVAATLFVNNIRPIVSPQPDFHSWICQVSDCSHAHLCCHRGEVSPRSPPDFPDLGRTPPELQVFLL